jgi:hypothetical protein
MRKKEIDAASGKITNKRILVRCAPYPISKLLATAIAVNNTQASSGMAFHQAAYVYPCEFRTSFMPETARPTIAFG